MSDARNYVSPEQIAQARQVGTLDYLQRYEPGELTKTYSANGKTMHCKPGEYRTKTHDSLAIHGNWFYWWSRGFGGRSALDYLVKVKEMPFQDAVRTLTAEAPVLTGQPGEVPQTAPVQSAEPEQKEIRLPPESRDTSRVFAYLSKTRGIDREIITHCFEHRLLYQDANHHNAVFIGYEGRRPRFGSMRSTLSDSKWRMDLPGSDKRFSFCMDNPNSAQVVVCEAPIDAMSLATIAKEMGRDWQSVSYLSLSGTAPTALEHYLSTHPDTRSVTIALDNDEPGQRNAELLRSMVEQRFPQVECHVSLPPPDRGKDWNDVLQYRHQRRRARGNSLSERLSQARAAISEQQPMSPVSRPTYDRDAR